MKVVRFEHIISVIETTVEIAVSKRYEMSDLDKSICWLLKETGNISAESIGILLGLGTTEFQFPEDEGKIHKDLIEVELLKELLSKVESFHLINSEEASGTIKLTEQGEIGLDTSKKYNYLNAKFAHYKFLDLTVGSEMDPFPYHKLGLVPEIQEGWPEKDLPDYLSESLIPDSDINQMKKSLHSSDPQIELKKVINSNLGKKERVIDISVEVDLASKNISFFYEEEDAIEELNMIVGLNENSNFKEYLTQKGIYLNYIESELIFDMKLLDQFSKYDFFSINSLIEKNLIQWTADFIQFIKNWEGTDSKTWELLSLNCTFDLILEQISKLNSFVDWERITSRFIDTPDVILSNWNLNWDSDQILSNFNQTHLEKYLEVLYLNVDEKIDTTFSHDQWVLITSLVSDSFLSKHVYALPFDFRYISREKKALTENLITTSSGWKSDPWNRDLDWSYISENYDLDFLAKNYTLIQDYVDPETLILKLGQFPDRLSKFLNSSQTRQLKEKLHEVDFKVGRDTSLILNTELLFILDELGFVQWGNQFFTGIEHNPTIEWNEDLIKRYKDKLLECGSQPISINVTSLNVVKNYPELNWNFLTLLSICEINEFEYYFLEWCEMDSPEEWSALLMNRSDLPLETILLIISHENWLVENIDWLKIIDRYDDISTSQLESIFSYLKEDQNEVKSHLSKRISLNLALENSNLNWDWTILTNRMIDTTVDPNLFQIHKSKVDWELIIRHRYSREEITKQEIFDDIKPNLDSASAIMRKKASVHITQAYLDQKPIEDHFDKNRNYFDWELISGNHAFILRLMRKAISGDFEVFQNITNEVNKVAFTGNAAFISSLKKLEVESPSGWKKRIEDLLKNLEEIIDWKTLSNQKEFSSYEFLISLFRDRLDWTGISTSSSLLVSKEQTPNIEVITKYKSHVDFYAITSRSDLVFDNNFVLSFIDKKLNYSYLSIAENSKITEQIFYASNRTERSNTQSNHEIFNCPWDFNGLSSKSGFWDSGKALSMYPDKPWNWKEVLLNKRVKIGEKIVKELMKKNNSITIDWLKISSQPNFSIQYKTLKSFQLKTLADLNWSYISTQTEKWKYTEILEFKDYWNWNSLAWLKNGVKKSTEIKGILDMIDIVTLSEIIDPEELFLENDNLNNYVDWSIVCRRPDCQKYLYDHNILEKKCDYVDWTYLSSLTTFSFTAEILDTYSDYWNWGELGRNPVIKESYRSVLENQLGSSNKLEFINRLSQNRSPWAGNVYHFTHIENALKILENECIYSRNAVVDFDDSAGSVVGRRDTAHNFARFYFRPQTLTQFYNEQLGKDQGMKYFDSAYRLELPKCPIPIFFQFDLLEILQKKEFDCYVSNGNMQTNNARVIKLEDSLSVFDFNHVYEKETWNFKKATQQEFLIRNQFDFSTLKSFRIMVPDQFTKSYLESLITSEKIKKRIQVATYRDEIFHFENRSIDIEAFSNKETKISTDYRNKHHFEVVFDEIPQIEVLDGSDLTMSTNRIKFSNWLNMRLKKSCNYKVEFYNELKKEPWTIVKTML